MNENKFSGLRLDITFVVIMLTIIVNSHITSYIHNTRCKEIEQRIEQLEKEINNGT
jgi:hypothetical protein